MLVALIAKDKAGALSVRQENRPAHVEYLKSTGVVAQAGPLLDDAGGKHCGHRDDPDSENEDRQQQLDQREAMTSPR